MSELEEKQSSTNGMLAQALYRKIIHRKSATHHMRGNKYVAVDGHSCSLHITFHLLELDGEADAVLAQKMDRTPVRG